MIRKITTWIVIADGARARVYENDGPSRGIHPVSDMSASGPRGRDREIGPDRPGRAFDSAGHGRHAFEETDRQDRAEAEFLSDLMDELSSAAAAGRYDRLVLVAAPRALGMLRKVIPAALAKCIHGEIDKDLTRASKEAIEKQVSTVLAV